MFSPAALTPIETIKAFCNEVQSFLEAHYEADNAHAATDRLVICCEYMATTGKMLADAKHYLRLHTEAIIDACADSKAKLSPSIFKLYIEAKTRDYEYWVDWLDRLNRACTHNADFQRTIISKLREEARLAGQNQG